MIEVPPGGDIFKLKITAVAGGEPFTFPVEPRVWVRRRNRIIRKYPQKGLKGSIKERWMVDDFDVTIRANFIGEAGYLEELRQQIPEQTPTQGIAPGNSLKDAVNQRLEGEAKRLGELGTGILPAQAAGAPGRFKKREKPVQPVNTLVPSYPRDTIQELLELCRKVYWQVSGNEQLNALDITHLVVYDVELPFTAGELNQEVVIRGFSDDADQ